MPNSLWFVVVLSFWQLDVNFTDSMMILAFLRLFFGEKLAARDQEEGYN